MVEVTPDIAEALGKANNEHYRKIKEANYRYIELLRAQHGAEADMVKAQKIAGTAYARTQGQLKILTELIERVPSLRDFEKEYENGTEK